MSQTVRRNFTTVGFQQDHDASETVPLSSAPPATPKEDELGLISEYFWTLGQSGPLLNSGVRVVESLGHSLGFSFLEASGDRTDNRRIQRLFVGEQAALSHLQMGSED